MCLCASTSICMCRGKKWGRGCGGWFSLIIKRKNRELFWANSPVGAGRPDMNRGQASIKYKTEKLDVFPALHLTKTMTFAILTQCRYSSVCTGVVFEVQARWWGWGSPAWATETWLETWGFSFSQLGTHLEITKYPQNKGQEYWKLQAKPQVYEL